MTTPSSPADLAPLSADFPADGRSPEKHRSILAAAAELFLSAGYHRTTMDAVAERAEVSKATVYKHFANKTDLFEAIVRARCDQLFSQMSDPAIDAGDMRTALSALGRHYLTLLLDPMSLELYRALVGENERDPELGRQAYAVGGAVVIAHLAAHLQRWTSEGRLSVPDTAMAAEQFYGMLTGHLQLRALLDVGDPPDGAALDRLTESCVTLFLRGYSAGTSR